MCLFHVLLYIVMCPFWFCNHLDSFCFYVALPHGAVSRSAVCDCGIF